MKSHEIPMKSMVFSYVNMNKKRERASGRHTRITMEITSFPCANQRTFHGPYFQWQTVSLRGGSYWIAKYGDFVVDFPQENGSFTRLCTQIVYERLMKNGGLNYDSRFEGLDTLQ